MTDNLSEISEERTQESTGQPLDNSPGSQLQRAREKAGLSREELSRRLCMTGNKLELLERDEYDRLPGALYVRGYIRNICKELHIDAGPVLQAYSGYCNAEEESREILAHVSRGPVMEARKRSFKGLALLPLLLVGGVFWWMHGRDAIPPAIFTGHAESDRSIGNPVEVPGEGLEAAPVEAEMLQTAAELAQPVPDDGDVMPSGDDAEALALEPEQELVVQSQPLVADQAEETAEATEIPEATIEAAVPAAAGAELQLAFDEDSWVEVTDASGSVLLAKLKPAGSEVSLTGQPPFQLMLGNASGARVRYRGELVDSAPIGNRRTRRLTVGE